MGLNREVGKLLAGLYEYRPQEVRNVIMSRINVLDYLGKEGKRGRKKRMVECLDGFSEYSGNVDFLMPVLNRIREWDWECNIVVKNIFFRRVGKTFEEDVRIVKDLLSWSKSAVRRFEFRCLIDIRKKNILGLRFLRKMIFDENIKTIGVFEKKDMVNY